MRINLLSPISFQKLPMCEQYGMKIVDEFTYRAQEQNLSSYTVKHYKFKKECIEFRFKNKSQIAASEEVKITPQKTLFVSAMYTTPEMQHKYGFGKSMHLLNIVEMLENDADSIELDATGEAIPFHTRMGFYPDDKWANGLQTNIRIISNNYTPELQKYAQKAKKLIEDEKVSIDMEDINKRGNKILYEYTKEALKIKNKDELNSLFASMISMKLTKENVLSNKSFYNNLFDKYDIDYHID